MLWKGKTKGNLLGYKIFIFLIKYVNISFAYFILVFVAAYFYHTSRKSFKAIFYYYHRILKYNTISSWINIYKNYYTFGQVLLDKVAILSGSYDKYTFQFDGEENLGQISNQQSGGILIGAHIGNFEVAGHLLHRLNTKINIVVYDAEHEQIKKLLSGVYKLDNFGDNVRFLPVNNDLSYIFEINNIIRNKELLIFLGDRYVEGSKTISVDFMGAKALFPAGPFILALSLNAPVSFVFTVREKRKHYHFYASPPKIYQNNKNRKNPEQDIQQIIQDYLESLEKIIRKYPHQWFNFYQFWE